MTRLPAIEAVTQGITLPRHTPGHKFALELCEDGVVTGAFQAAFVTFLIAFGDCQLVVEVQEEL